MRETHRCPKCRGEEILYVPEVTDSHHDHLGIDVTEGWWLPEKLVGPFEVYLCRACGFAELYVRDAGQIQIDRVKGARLLTPRDRGGG